MGQVSVTLNGRTYRLECGEGEEAHLIELAEYLGTHVDVVKRKFGQVGDDRLILMASLQVMDELWELRRQMQEMKTAMAEARDGTESPKLRTACAADASFLTVPRRRRRLTLP